MFNLSGSELVFLIVIALVVLGPDKLPDAMRRAGKAYADFKKMTTGFQNEMKSVLDEPMREFRETADLAKKAAMFDFGGDTKPQSGTMKAQEPKAAEVPATAAVTAATATPDPEPATVDTPIVNDDSAGAEPPIVPEVATEQAAEQPVEPAKNLGPNFTSAAPRASQPVPDTTDESAVDTFLSSLAGVEAEAAEAEQAAHSTPSDDDEVISG